MQNFRPEALERLSSPEQLNRLMTVTRPVGWLALSTIGVLLAACVTWGFLGRLPTTVTGPGILLEPQALDGVVSMVEGQVVEVLVQPGQVIPRGTVVARIQSATAFPRTARVDILSPFAGRVADIVAKPGSFVAPGQSLLRLTSEPSELEAFLYLPLDQGKKVRPGMTVRLAPSTVNVDEYGYLEGRVIHVAEFNSTQAELVDFLGSDELAEVMTQGGTFQKAPLQVRVRLVEDLKTPSGYRWSSKQGPDFKIRESTLLVSSIVTDFQRPVDMVIPYLDKMLGASDW